MKQTVTCLIPAWNEAARIGTVLCAAVGHPLLAEVIVIDDASTDGTAQVVERYGARVLRQPVNGGKSAAIARGLAEAQGDLILLLDADLAGLTTAHVSDLLAPVLSGQADAAISLRANAPLVWRVIGLDYISGERVMPRGMLANHLPHIAALRRFGLEVFVNELWVAQGIRLAVVPLAVASPAKASKYGLWPGLRADAAMLGDIARTVGFGRALVQIIALRSRRLAWPLPHRGIG
jgi:glycosyltransferase involved in cell wall biosynthesis